MNHEISIDIWISNGLEHVRIYRVKDADVDRKISFTRADKTAIWFEIQEFLKQEKYIHPDIYKEIKSRLESL